jgi:hypothetical protein
MRLTEFEKHPGKMTKEELEIHMLNILKEMNQILDTADQRMDQEHAATDRNGNPEHL